MPSPSASSPVPASAAPTDAEARATLRFEIEGKPVRSLTKRDLIARIPAETITTLDPYHHKKKRFRALPLRRVLEAGFAGRELDPAKQHFVLRASDGYTVPIEGARLVENGGYLAVEDLDVPGWEPIGDQRVDPGPYYVIWKGDDQRDTATHPRPWQLAAIEVSRFERSFPHTVPEGEAEGSAAMRGFELFRGQCIRCHAINREGGRVGPDLNVPQSIIDYRPAEQIRAYIKNPRTFRYGNMPANPHLSDADLDDLMAYFRAMSRHKHDPDRGATPAHGTP